MKKMMFVLLCVVVVAGFAMAQSYVPTQDVLGAHQNYGRGCSGCHQPHSGAGAAGGNAITGASIAVDKTNSGNDALFGQDLGPLYGMTMAMGDSGKYVETLPASGAFTVGNNEIRGIMMCLACHDGAVAKGAMMQGNSYEQRLGLLPAGAYGNAPIPTLLGADGWGTGASNAYNNDHPVGIAATLGAVRLISNATDTSSLTAVVTATGITSIVPTPGSAYASFVQDYGMPAIAGTSHTWGVNNPTGNTDPSKLYLTCTTCHNQHAMNVYASNTKASGGGLAGSLNGTYKTYFFINGPYNVDQYNNGTTFTNKAASVAQFCRQCHFGESNESVGLNLPTQF
jgi:hypothetical protein